MSTPEDVCFAQYPQCPLPVEREWQSREGKGMLMSPRAPLLLMNGFLKTAMVGDLHPTSTTTTIKHRMMCDTGCGVGELF